jgi:hypothetical protein
MSISRDVNESAVGSDDCQLLDPYVSVGKDYKTNEKNSEYVAIRS